MSLKEQYRRAKRPPTVVPIDGLGDVRIRSLTVGELKRLQAMPSEQAGTALIMAAVVDETGAAVFTDAADFDDMGNDVLTDLAGAVLKVCNPKVEDQKKLRQQA